MLERFLADNLRRCDGHKVRFKDLHHKFLATLGPADRYAWTRGVFSEAINSLGYQTGRGYGNKTWVINTSENPLAIPTNRFLLVGDRRIRREVHV